MRKILSFLLLPYVAVITACDAPDAALNDNEGALASAPSDENDDAPLASYEDIMAGVPANSELPLEPQFRNTIPKQFDIIEQQTPVKSQGSRGVCSIFSTVALMENLYLKAGMANPDFSEQYLQWSVKVELGKYQHTMGSNARENIEAIATFGIPAEEAWPFEPYPWTTIDDPGCVGKDSSSPVECFTNGHAPESAEQAKQYNLKPGKFINASNIKSHMVKNGTAVVVGLDFFYQAWNHRKSTLPTNSDYWAQGIVTYPNATDRTESHKQRAGHSILIVGWDDNLEVQSRDANGNLRFDGQGKPVMEKGFYIFKNSWGTEAFGIDNPHGPGYGYLSMRYVHEEGSAVVTNVPVL